MKKLTVTLIDQPPSRSRPTEYPHYLVSEMLKAGISKMEATCDKPDSTTVDWVLTPRLNGGTRAVASQSVSEFRSVLAAFAGLLKLDPYGSHTLFETDYPIENRPVAHRFSLYICNEPTMAIWAKLYLYCIDGIWPTKK